MNVQSEEGSKVAKDGKERLLKVGINRFFEVIADLLVVYGFWQVRVISYPAFVETASGTRVHDCVSSTCGVFSCPAILFRTLQSPSSWRKTHRVQSPAGQSSLLHYSML